MIELRYALDLQILELAQFLKPNVETHGLRGVAQRRGDAMSPNPKGSTYIHTHPNVAAKLIVCFPWAGLHDKPPSCRMPCFRFTFLVVGPALVVVQLVPWLRRLRRVQPWLPPPSWAPPFVLLQGGRTDAEGRDRGQLAPRQYTVNANLMRRAWHHGYVGMIVGISILWLSQQSSQHMKHYSMCADTEDMRVDMLRFTPPPA